MSLHFSCIFSKYLKMFSNDDKTDMIFMYLPITFVILIAYYCY
jgi:hypothetical protein